MPTLPTNPHSVGDSGHVNDHNTIVTAISGLYTQTFSGKAPSVSVTNSTDQTLGASAYTNLNFNTEIYDDDNFHSTSTNTSRLTIPTGMGGYYLVIANIFAVTNTVGMDILVNGTGARYFGQTGTGRLASSSVIKLAAGDYVQLSVYAAATTTVYGTASLGDYSPTFSAQYLRAL